MTRQQCRFCGNNLVENNYHDWFSCYECEICGKYILPESTILNMSKYDVNKLKAYLFYNKISDRCAFIGTQKAFQNYINKYPSSTAFFVSPETVENWYPKTFAERIDQIILWLAKQTKYLGAEVSFDTSNATCLFFIKNDESNLGDWSNEIEFYIEYLKVNNYIHSNVDVRLAFLEKKMHMTLSHSAWERVYELQRNQSMTKDVFVAMTFHKSANEIRQAIKKGIDSAEYSSVLMDEIVHNHQIVPEMLRLIKESRFVIMDITQPNYGAYYEVGYAQGLGKEVIITCKREVWDQKDFVCEKDKDCRYKQLSTKPHFDIAQKQVLVWDDYADLTKKLTEWIKHLIG